VLDLADGDPGGLAHALRPTGQGQGSGAQGGHLEEGSSAHGA
jgi:hypothetical protein